MTENAKPKTLPSTYLRHTADHWWQSYSIGAGPKADPLPPGTELADLLQPNYWQHHHTKLNLGDLIRVRAPDGSFDVMLTCVAKDSAGIVLDFWPRFPAMPSEPARRTTDE